MTTPNYYILSKVMARFDWDETSQTYRGWVLHQTVFLVDLHSHSSGKSIARRISIVSFQIIKRMM